MSQLELPKPFFVLAPMDDVTDMAFRQVVADCAAPDLFFTEFANVDGLQSPGRPRLLKKLRFAPSERRLVAHIWGLNPENFYKTAHEIVDGTLAHEFGLLEDVNYVGIDLNMGCPAKSEVHSGACSALINNRPLAAEIIQATQEGAEFAGQRMPVSVKTRLGFNAVDLSWHEFLLEKKLNMLTIHARTRKEMSKVPAHWEEFGRIRELRDKLAPGTLLVGNGDIENREQGEALARKYGLDGIMIGRGVFRDPFVFAENSPWVGVGRGQRIELFRRHVERFATTWREGERPTHTLNKFCKVYISDFDGAKELREQLMEARSIEELLTMIKIAEMAQCAVA
jgi:tRNA-dihydrouridine synthase